MVKVITSHWFFSVFAMVLTWGLLSLICLVVSWSSKNFQRNKQILIFAVIKEQFSHFLLLWNYLLLTFSTSSCMSFFFFFSVKSHFTCTKNLMIMLIQFDYGLVRPMFSTGFWFWNSSSTSSSTTVLYFDLAVNVLQRLSLLYYEHE